MGRTKGSLNKKIKSIESEIKPEVQMSETETLESMETEIDKVRIDLENAKRELEEKKNEIKKLPAREISEEEVLIVKKQVSGIVKNSALKGKIEMQRQLDSQMVTGKFINRRVPGQSVKLTYLKYETDPVKWYTLEDGKVYTIPRGFADQLNEYYHTPHFIQRAGEMDPTKPESAIHEVDTSNKKYAFVPINF